VVWEVQYVTEEREEGRLELWLYSSHGDREQKGQINCVKVEHKKIKEKGMR
jgi:hypothetical protein